MGKQKTFLLSANDLKIAIKSTKAPKTLCIFINKQHLLSLKSGRAQVSLGPSSLEGCVTNYHIVPPEITHFASKQCIEVKGSKCKPAGPQTLDSLFRGFSLGLRPGKPWARALNFGLYWRLYTIQDSRELATYLDSKNIVLATTTAKCSTSLFQILF